MNKLETALTATGFPFAHFAFVKAPEETYLVWGETGAEPLRTGGHQAERITYGNLDCFTRDGSGLPMQKVEAELNKIEHFAFRLDSIQFEEETGLIHYAWDWSMV